MKKSAGNLYIISAPSGAGKTSLVKDLLQQEDDIILSVSHTTRAQRPGEEDGVHYHFVDESVFEEIIARDGFIEHAHVFGNHYGTSENHLQEDLDRGQDVILEIDWQGGKQVKEKFPDCIGIFILPPSRDELLKRLQNRGQDSDEIIQGRMDQAISEVSHYAQFDYLVVNDSFEHALAELKAIVHSNRLQYKRQVLDLNNLITDLLKASD